MLACFKIDKRSENKVMSLIDSSKQQFLHLHQVKEHYNIQVKIATSHFKHE